MNEDKLPKWAQSLLEAERTRAALSWPTEAEPVPVCIGNSATGEITGDRSDADLWSFNSYTREVKMVTLRRGFAHRSDTTSWGSRLEGPLYATERDAFVALRWAIARKCANELRAVDIAAKEAEERG